MKLNLPSLLTFSTVMLSLGCTDHNIENTTYPEMAEATNPVVLTTANGINVYNGGFGSALVQDPKDHNVFYLLTDRGPNIDGTVANSKVFASPDFAPQIGKFRLSADQLTLEKVIELKNENGNKLNGLPNPVGQGFSGEIALDLAGKTLSNSADGLDSEGMAMAQDGSFWISDEYGPHLVHFDADGKTIERINPFGSGKGGRKIPLVFASRRPNRGMEGLTITPDGKTLVGIMQFPLYNPSAAAVTGSLVTRILAYDIMEGTSKEYVYLIDRANLQANSEIVAISNTEFLVLERDGEYATDANRSTVIKKIYKINISAATDISDPSNGAKGKLYGSSTVEELKTAAALSSNGITPVTKTLVADLMTDISSLYPHDKAEGMAIINSTTIAVSNDDDFGVTGTGTYISKILPATGKVDKNRIYFIKLKQPLW
ncbi:esterase-like activity of phytase family protein [Dyadobacter subterraneus]|uniref:Esterase-like activity of phytase family protein n=1 Tax=Dyadobacter subterraneus TaxID=2773304 RepID=A0ABR9W9J7_9BACT|nr:esterase-like activity of phytase family protein [Dyadobacter subterraneus]MBE9462158.1 esterase-like activity of phytase family protein [Dyadobacter subterraneus]